MAPKDVHTLILEPVNVTSHCKTDFEDVMKVITLRCPGLSGGHSLITRSLTNGRRKRRESEREI